MKLKVFFLYDDSELLEIFAETFGCTEIEIETFFHPEDALEENTKLD
jgi:hypothetical protein